MLAWMGFEWWRKKKPSGAGIAAGTVAGLAAITPASGYVPPWAAIIIGATAGTLCYLAVNLKDLLHYDDSLDVVGVHMVGGLVGVVLTGAFSSLAVNAAGEPGGWTQFGRQVVLALVGVVYPFVATWLILLVTDKLVGLKVSEDDEETGLDFAEHGEGSYDWTRPLATLASAPGGAGSAVGGSDQIVLPTSGAG
jgi:ammonium transporter, Amt family